MEEFCIIVLNSSNASMHLYKLLKDRRLDVSIISTPCTISAGCSRAIKIKEKDIDIAIQEIKKNRTLIKGIYKKSYSGNRFYYIKIY